MSSNGIPLRKDGRQSTKSWGCSGLFLGVRMMHLTYNRRNMISDGCAERSDAGLSDFGSRRREMNRVGIIVDVAHSGERTSLEAARISERPVVVTRQRALNDHFVAKAMK